MDTSAPAASTAFVVPGAGIVVVAPATGKTASTGITISGLLKRVAPPPRKPPRATEDEQYDII